MTPEQWTRVKSLAMRAWEQPHAERAAYIATACDGDAELQREVQSLVVSMQQSEGCFEEPPVVLDDHRTAASLVGRRIGAYEILARIGAGGMGEVYKARDARLDRIVAIKVSHVPIAREARAVAALSHPHICTVHDIGTDDGVDYFVMEFVDGETLATRLARGALPAAEALRYAEQIAAALSEAHRAGVIHRDVKPANIMLHAGADGITQAKLLDFGVAKSSTSRAVHARHSPVSGSSADLTVAGFIVGTPYYMAPEQLDGHGTDRRTDIFAFGAVLFEMLTARKALAGANRGEVLAAIRSGAVSSPSQGGVRVSPALDRLVLRCLAANPNDRYQSADELLMELRAVQRGLDSSRRRQAMAVAAVLLLATGGLAAWILSGRDTAAQPAMAPMLVRLAASAGVIGAPALSPDGSRVVFPWVGDGVDNPELMLLSLGSTTKQRLTRDPAHEEWPAWSPDGTQVAFIRCGTADCGIFALKIQEGEERKIRQLRLDRYTGLAWSADGRSLVYAERSSKSTPYALVELSLGDGSTRRLTSPPGGNGDFRFAFSPDGSALGIIRLEERGIAVRLVALATRTEKMLLQGQHEWFGSIAWSSDARHLIVSANQQGVRRLWRLPVNGGELEQLAIAGEDSYYPSVKGNRLVFVRDFRDWDLSAAGMTDGKLQRATSFSSSTRLDLDPAFSPDGQKLAFVSERSGSREIWVSDADGANASQLTSLRGPLAGRPAWSPDGRHIAFHGGGIRVVSAQGGAERRLAEDGEMPAWSADAAWIYFIRNRGTFSLWKIPVAGGTAVQALPAEVSAAREAPLGGDLYSVRIDGIWRRPRDGTSESRVVTDSAFGLPGYWAVMNDGIYYVQRAAEPNNTFTHHLKFYDFVRRRAADLGPLIGNIDEWVGGLTVSPDRRTAVYSQRTYESSEIMLVEQFR